jgi:hypothetical protein
MGREIGDLAAYFDSRRKRNHVDYDFALVASDTEVEELLSNAEEFRATVEIWIRTQHPAYAVQP